MSEKSIAEKLQIKSGRKVLLVNAPRGYKTALGSLPKGAVLLKSAGEPADVVQVFVSGRGEMEAQLPALKAALAPGGMLWVTYYKGTSSHKTDINRDRIWEFARTIGMEAVSLVSIDDDWSAMRLKAI